VNKMTVINQLQKKSNMVQISGENNDKHKTGAIGENLTRVSSIEHPIPGSKIATDDQMTPGIKEIRGEIEKNIKENEKKRVARYQLPQCRYQLPQCEGNEKKVEYFSNIVNYAAMILESVEGKSDGQKLGKWTKDLQSDFLKLKTAFEKSSDQQNSLDILRKNKKLTQSLQGTIREIVADLAKHNQHEDKSILDIFMEKNTYLNSDEMKKHVDLNKHEFRLLKNHVDQVYAMGAADLINCQDIYKALSCDLPYCYKLKGGKNATPHSKEIPHGGNTNPTDLVRPPLEESGHQSTHVHHNNNNNNNNNYNNYYYNHKIEGPNQTPKISQQTQTNDDNDDNNDDDSTVQLSGVGVNINRPQSSDLTESVTPVNANKHTKTKTTEGGATWLKTPETHTTVPGTWGLPGAWNFSRDWERKIKSFIKFSLS